MEQIFKNSITGKEKLIIKDDGVYNAITGKKVAYIENGDIVSVYTGRSVGSVVSAGEGGEIDLSFITAEAEDILLGKVSVDKNGNKITGTLKKGTDVSATTATASDVKEGKQFYNASGVLTDGTNTDVNVSDTTAEAPDVLDGKKFYNAAGVLTTGTLVPQSGGGGSEEYYLCTYVNRNYFSYNTIIVSGMPVDAWVGATYMDYNTWESKPVPEDIAARNPNGIYVLQNPDAQYVYEYVWKKEDGCVIVNSEGIVIEPDQAYVGTYRIRRDYYSDNDKGYPAPDDYTSYPWVDGSYNQITGASVAVPDPEPVEQYWNGCKLIQNEDGLWEYSSENVRLSYGDYMPVNGRFYNADCSMEIGNVNFAEKYRWACSHGMANIADFDKATEVEVVDMYGTMWKVSTNGAVYSGSIVGAFDADLNTKFQEQSNSNIYTYIQWQNLERPVIVKELEMYTGYPHDDAHKMSFFGSNDGENWELLFNKDPEFDYVSEGMASCRHKWVVTNDYPPYYYYRLQSEVKNTSFCVYDLRAYSQKTREVPK